MFLDTLFLQIPYILKQYPRLLFFFSRLCEVNKRKRLQYGGGYYSHSEKIASIKQKKLMKKHFQEGQNEFYKQEEETIFSHFSYIRNMIYFPTLRYRIVGHVHCTFSFLKIFFPPESLIRTCLFMKNIFVLPGNFI